MHVAYGADPHTSHTRSLLAAAPCSTGVPAHSLPSRHVKDTRGHTPVRMCLYTDRRNVRFRYHTHITRRCNASHNASVPHKNTHVPVRVCGVQCYARDQRRRRQLGMTQSREKLAAGCRPLSPGTRAFAEEHWGLLQTRLGPTLGTPFPFLSPSPLFPKTIQGTHF